MYNRKQRYYQSVVPLFLQPLLYFGSGLAPTPFLQSGWVRAPRISAKLFSGLAPRRPAKLLGAGSARTAHSQSADFALLTRTLVACRIRGTRSVSRRAAILLIHTSARTSLTQSLQDAAEQGCHKNNFEKAVRSRGTTVTDFVRMS